MLNLVRKKSNIYLDHVIFAEEITVSTDHISKPFRSCQRPRDQIPQIRLGHNSLESFWRKVMIKSQPHELVALAKTLSLEQIMELCGGPA